MFLPPYLNGTIMSKLPKNIEIVKFNELLDKLKYQRDLALSNNLMTPDCILYISDWIDGIESAYNSGYFDLDEKDRANCEWNKFSYARYDWGDSIKGLISEVIACSYFQNTTKQGATCVLAPDDRINQINGIDLVQTYDYYKVTIQVKTGEFSGSINDPYLHIFHDWIASSKPDSSKFHRIAIVDQQNGYILVSDYDKFRQAAVLTDDGWVVNVCKVRMLDKRAQFAQY